MTIHRTLFGLAALFVLAACSTDAPTSPEPPVDTLPPSDTIPSPPPALAGTWSARIAEGVSLPYVVERFNDWPAPPSVHEIQLDHGQLELTGDGKFRLKVYWSEWKSADPTRGAEWVLHVRFTDVDFGTWTRSGAEVVLTSHWIQNRVTYGTVKADGSLQLRHGLVWGDPLLAVGYKLNADQ